MSDLVERLRDADTTRRIGESYADTHERRQRDRAEAAARIAQLEAALRAAYEVYAGSEGFIAQTCAEGYQRQIITQMVGCISSALDAPRMTDDQAEAAVRRHDEYFHDHVLKMVLGNCVRLFGVRATRVMLLRYARQLEVVLTRV